MKNIPYNGPIGLQDWLKNHRVPVGHTFVHRGNTVVVNGNHYDYRKDDTLNSTQMAHIRGELDIYRPVQTYEEQWTHDNRKQTWAPIDGTKKRNDLPPIYMQWKRQAYKRDR